MYPAIIIGIDWLPGTSAAKLNLKSLTTLPLDLETADLVGIQAKDDDQAALIHRDITERYMGADRWLAVQGYYYAKQLYRVVQLWRSVSSPTPHRSTPQEAFDIAPCMRLRFPKSPGAPCCSP